ncbi:hypothetical protein HMPREF0863_04136 [Erysipelotrichaceae bacterium 5_2_54FAA]|nr:hypothetical protein HMPREF0863_04136 [Erysipelotrichaceae bacterium 5_2_54FAA]
MIKLCVFDVDGTLITKGDRQFSYNTITALKNLAKARSEAGHCQWQTSFCHGEETAGRNYI